MLDPRGVAVVIRRRAGGVPVDKTLEISFLEQGSAVVRVRFGQPKEYTFGWDLVTILERPERMPPGARLLVDGDVVEAAEGYLFTGPGAGQGWWHVLTNRRGWEAYSADRVVVAPNATIGAGSHAVLGYWRTVVEQMSGDAARVLQRNHQRLNFIHAESALARILGRAPIEPLAEEAMPLALYPFRTNISQSAAVDNAMRYPISVIDGPPGTGKTQTILNIVASVICRPGATVGVVSFSNSAVDNVFEKLTREGFGMVAANLGSAGKREGFFDTQGPRNAAVDALVGAGPVAEAKAADRLRKVNRQLDDLLKQDRRRAELQQQLHGFRLEQRHFESFFERGEVPGVNELPLLRRYRADKLLAFIEDTDPRWIRDGSWGRMTDIVQRYFKYRALRQVDAGDADVILRIERLYYQKRIAELEQQVGKLGNALAGKKFEDLLAEQARLSQQLLRDSLCTRYGSMGRSVYRKGYQRRFEQFAQDYPLILSTCHSLQNSVGAATLLDYLIIDEASQVDLVTVAPVLACARNLIVVGDLEQLPPVTKELAGVPSAPDPIFDYRNSVLSAIINCFGDPIRRTMLREHYRCDPDIIEFCNRKFYGRKLIPYTSSETKFAPMTVVRTSPGNHMRYLRGDDSPATRGRSNQREIDVIQREVIPWISADIALDDIGVTTPYRRQADKVTDALIDSIEADTVHKFQGREKDAIIMTTVLDNTKSSRAALQFADDPKLINVAVSRAVRLFVLVTHPSELPASRHLRDLIGYIRYRDPDNAVVDSDVVSIFDLLYTAQDKRRRKHPRIGWGRTEFPSEDIALTLLEEILTDPAYRHLAIHRQVPLQHVFPRDRARLTDRQREFIRNRSTFDFVIYNQITNANICAVEVDGFYPHEGDPEQRERDALKNDICQRFSFPIVRLATTGSNEAARVGYFLERLS
ncbi:AAA domain-containing protein (plasmid) [Nocardia sp. CWNU-33]|uniref:AAA domain-containing protein n=1 Tax=Nocardia sp. CWNU-33 TaxID=3392117 RepID=UPI00398E3DB7